MQQECQHLSLALKLIFLLHFCCQVSHFLRQLLVSHRQPLAVLPVTNQEEAHAESQQLFNNLYAYRDEKYNKPLLVQLLLPTSMNLYHWLCLLGIY